MFNMEPGMFPGGGWPFANGGGGWMSPMMSMAAYQPQQQAPTGAQQGDARLGRITGRIGNLQEQYKGADSSQQAGIQGRIDKLQGRAQGLRKDRRRGNGLYDESAPTGGAQPEPGMMPWGGGFNPWGGMPHPMAMGFGAPQGYRPSREAGAPSQGGAAQNPGNGFGPSTPTSYTGAYEAGNYASPFGQLVQSNSGDGRLAKGNNEGGPQYGFDGQSWQMATPDNMGSFVDPYQFAGAAGASRAQYSRRGNFLAADPNSGTYR